MSNKPPMNFILKALVPLLALGLAQAFFVGSATAQNRAAPLTLHTDAFADGGVVPDKYTLKGESLQPHFTIQGGPENIASFAIILHDVDVALKKSTTDVLHWIAWNIPGSAREFPEGSLPEGSVVGKNIRGENAYLGPGAPAGPYHHYVFELYALDVALDLPADASRADLLAAMEGHVIAKTAYVGRFHK